MHNLMFSGFNVIFNLGIENRQGSYWMSFIMMVKLKRLK